MRIGVMSDTHVPRKRKHIPKLALERLKGVDLILHAGDINDLSVLRTLNSIASTEAVAGNTDNTALGNMLGYQKELNIVGYRIGLTHGHRGKGRHTPEKALSLFPHADIVIFGHTHQPLQEWRGNTLLFNPGSACDSRFEPQCSIAILTLGESVHYEMIYYDYK